MRCWLPVLREVYNNEADCDDFKKKVLNCSSSVIRIYFHYYTRIFRLALYCLKNMLLSKVKIFYNFFLVDPFFPVANLFLVTGWISRCPLWPAIS